MMPAIVGRPPLSKEDGPKASEEVEGMRRIPFLPCPFETDFRV